MQAQDVDQAALRIHHQVALQPAPHRLCLDPGGHQAVVEGELAGLASTPFDALCATPETPAVDAAMAATGPDTVWLAVHAKG